LRQPLTYRKQGRLQDLPFWLKKIEKKKNNNAGRGKEHEGHSCQTGWQLAKSGSGQQFTVIRFK